MPDSSMVVLEDGLAVQRNKIPDYNCEGLGEALDTWQVWDRKNLLPYPGTWRQQPADVWALLKIGDSVYAKYQQQEAEKAEMMRKLKKR
jgi:hypothetical protein